MRPVAIVLVMVAALGVIAHTQTALRLRSGQASSSRTSRDGVFTEAQDKRGAAIYERECSTCHGATLRGGEGSPPLTGPDFSANWSGKTVGDLFDKIRQTMPAPPEEPGKLTPQQTADVVAHILSVNGCPPGANELSSDSQQLKGIRISLQ